MFRKPIPMQQQWDEQICHCLRSAYDENHAADGYDRWADLAASFRAARRLVYPLRNKAASLRDRAAVDLDVAERMENCPRNPRNGGDGFRTPGRPTATEMLFILGWGPTVAVPGFAAMVAVTGLALTRHPEHADSPMILLVAFAALLAGLLTMTLMSAVFQTALAARLWWRNLAYAVRYFARYGHWCHHDDMGPWCVCNWGRDRIRMCYDCERIEKEPAS
jgi:hypothetical protein